MFDAYQSLNEFNDAATAQEKELRRRLESEERLDLKKLMTVISKYRIEDVTNAKV